MFGFLKIKEELSINDFTLIFIRLLINFKFDNITEYADANVLNAEDVDKIIRQAFYFQLFIFYNLLFEYIQRKNLKITSEKLGYIFGYNLPQIMTEKEFSEASIESNINKLFSLMEDFPNSFHNSSIFPYDNIETEINKKGIYFFICVYFARTIFKPNLTIETERLKDFAIVGIFHQIYKSLHQTFNIALKQYKLTYSD